MHLRTTIRLPPQVRPPFPLPPPLTPSSCLPPPSSLSLPLPPFSLCPPTLVSSSLHPPSPTDSAWQTQIETRLSSLTSTISSILTALEARGIPVPLSQPLDTRPIVPPSRITGADGGGAMGNGGAMGDGGSEEVQRDEKDAQRGNVFLNEGEAEWATPEEQ